MRRRFYDTPFTIAGTGILKAENLIAITNSSRTLIFDYPNEKMRNPIAFLPFHTINIWLDTNINKFRIYNGNTKLWQSTDGAVWTE
jgi:hypothetical protein